MSHPVNMEARRAKQIQIMKGCFDCYAKNGLAGVGIKAVSEACGCNVASIYQYFDNLDDLIIKSTQYCMTEVENDFIARLQAEPDDLWQFIEELPYWTAGEHGSKYRLMYQVYTHPKYREHGQKFFEGIDERYTEYARGLEEKTGIPCEKLTGLIFILIRACVHYALFEDDFYLKSQIEVLKETLTLFIEKYGNSKEEVKEER
ncbi:MAG: TetR/AcrR family transcriptional regulator [Anaerovoracaceae bacterium]